MKLSTKLGMVMAMALGLVTIAKGQDEAPGQQIVMTGTKLPANGYTCGRSTYPIYCYGIPSDDGGTFWLDVYWNAYPKPTGFISWNNVADLGQASVTAATLTKNPNGQVSQLDITFNGLTVDGDNDSYSGIATFNFSYVKMTGGSGRGGGYPGYLLIVTGYTMTITYN